MSDDTNKCICDNCQRNEAEQPHECPYKKGFCGESDLCNCCDTCSGNCFSDFYDNY